MKKVKVELKGLSPLLMNNPLSMIEDAQSSGLKAKTGKYDLTKEAEKLAYRTKKGELYVPSTAIRGCLLNASSFKKIGKYSAKSILSGAVFMLGEELPLGVKTYELDIRTVVVQKARVVKARPKIDNWTLKFEFEYDDSLIGDDLIIKTILEDAGKRIGILDFRPQKTGTFGRFEVSKWQIV